jgi:hypothetical protein
MNEPVTVTYSLEEVLKAKTFQYMSIQFLL